MIDIQELYDWPAVNLAAFAELNRGCFLEFVGEESTFMGVVAFSDQPKESKTFGEMSSWINFLSQSASTITVQICSADSKRMITVNASLADKTLFISLNLQAGEMNEGLRLLEEIEQTLSLLPVIATTC